MSKWWKEQYGKNVPVKHKCQFSWYCDGKGDLPTDSKTWMEAFCHKKSASFLIFAPGAKYMHSAQRHFQTAIISLIIIGLPFHFAIVEDD